MIKYLVFMSLFISSIVLAQSQIGQDNKIYLIKVKDSINPGTGEFIISSIKKANKEKVALLIIELDTPGGLVQTTRLIVQEILSSKTPIAVNVTPPGAHAGSAGVMITMAAHIAAMAPGTNIGAAHPVGLSPVPSNIQFSKDKDRNNNKENKSKDVVMEKALNDVLAFVKGIAETRKRNVEWALNSVRNSDSITSGEALKKGVIDFVVKDTNELILKLQNYSYKNIKGNPVSLNIKNHSIEELKISFKLRVLSFIANPNIAYLLMLVTLLGVYLELSHPGLILPDVVGVLSGILTLMSFHMLPITTAGIVLLTVGIVLIVLEFVIPGFGALGGGGTLALMLGGVFLIDPIKADFRIAYSLIIVSGIIFGIIVSIIAYFVLSSKKKKIQTGIEGMIGLEGVVYSYDPKKNKGKLKVRGEIWSFQLSDEVKAKSDEVKRFRLNADDQVTVIKQEKLFLVVRKS